MNRELAQVKSITNISGYYTQILALDLKERQTGTAGVSPPPTPNGVLFSPYLPHAMVVVFFLLFLGGITVLIYNRALNMKRSLTMLGVALVVSSIPFTLKLLSDTTSLQIKAGPDPVPHNVELAQTDATSLSVSWNTEAQVVGSVKYGLSLKDARIGLSNGAKPGNSHRVDIKNLNAGVLYELEIISGTNTYNQNGAPLTFQLVPL